jgi:hypothetical protein
VVKILSDAVIDTTYKTVRRQWDHAVAPVLIPTCDHQISQPRRLLAASVRASSSTELVSSRVTPLINSGCLGADATVGRDGHRISTRSMISQTLSGTYGAMSPAASWTRVILVIG